ncbi:hypothetical protein FK529_14810 [Tsukamurella asaccharolytica]|uniref:Uncharacterized protein n=1 Tax=Tsukamurella asaccharolytica TaxID=2592067 RepID=A0A5C5R8C8_9ACTN|nr:hypothetical protein [Tsukamurella asaccharolytica]TWS18583.1 hypothetical protein FK529_14810 [Tsukamurella asaccharolytica]
MDRATLDAAAWYDPRVLGWAFTSEDGWAEIVRPRMYTGAMKLGRTQKSAREIAEAGIRAAELVAANPPDEVSLRAAREILELGVDGVERRLVERAQLG